MNFFVSFRDSESDDLCPNFEPIEIPPPTFSENESGNPNSQRIKCQFCNHILLETEQLIVLDCLHGLCENCYNIFLHVPQRPKICPICCQTVTNFK